MRSRWDTQRPGRGGGGGIVVRRRDEVEEVEAVEKEVGGWRSYMCKVRGKKVRLKLYCRQPHGGCYVPPLLYDADSEVDEAV